MFCWPFDFGFGTQTGDFERKQLMQNQFTMLGLHTVGQFVFRYRSNFGIFISRNISKWCTKCWTVSL